MKLNHLILSALISFCLMSVFTSLVSAEDIDESKRIEKKTLITILPLNITAGENDRVAVRTSVERFLLQRLNGQKYRAESVEKLKGVSPDELNKIYTALNSDNIDDRIKGDGNNYLCGGNVVVLGNSVMADFFLYHTGKKKKEIEHTLSGNAIGSVLSAAEVFAKKVKVLLEQSAADKSTVAVESDVPGNQGKKEKIFMKSEKVKGDITAVVFSRFDSTGKTYAVYSLADKIIAMEIADNQLVYTAEFKNKKHDKIIGLSSIDTDQDGVEELVVSNIKSNNRTISSYVLKWQGKMFKEVLSNINWIFSKSEVTDSNQFLYAQKHNTLKTTLDSGVYRVVFKKGQLVVDDNKIPLPSWVLLPGVSVDPIKDLFYGVAFRPDNRLRAFTEDGEVFWESSLSFGGGKVYFEEKHANERELNKRIWLNSPVMISDIFKGNKYPEIITVNNIDSTKQLLARVRSFNKSRLNIYAVSELSCNLYAQSDKIAGYISGFDINRTLSQEDVCFVYSVIQKGKSLFADNNSFIVIQNAGSFHKVK